MDKLIDSLLKQEMGMTLNQLMMQMPSLGELNSFLISHLKSKHPLRNLGVGSEGGIFQSEEQRSHTHIIGKTRVGKSKLIEHWVRMDIDQGNGLCLIDSSDNGQTVKDVLAYCAYKNRKRILYIDPLFQCLKDTPFWNKVVPIDLFGDYPDESADKVWDVVQIQFQQKDQSETPVIKQYLPAIIRVLHKAGLTLSETKYFTDIEYKEQREDIF